MVPEGLSVFRWARATYRGLTSAVLHGWRSPPSDIATALETRASVVSKFTVCHDIRASRVLVRM